MTATASGHRLDEYLQATLIGVARNSINIEIDLTPGVAIFPVMMAILDRDRNGRVSPAEESAYAQRVIREVELRVDGRAAPLRLVGKTFPTREQMQEGLGTIRLKFQAVRSGQSVEFSNRHLPEISAYLVNCLAPVAGDDGLTVGPQERDPSQKSIQFTVQRF